jgi:hypothetical protein
MRRRRVAESHAGVCWRQTIVSNHGLTADLSDASSERSGDVIGKIRAERADGDSKAVAEPRRFWPRLPNRIHSGQLRLVTVLRDLGGRRFGGSVGRGAERCTGVALHQPPVRPRGKWFKLGRIIMNPCRCFSPVPVVSFSSVCTAVVIRANPEVCGVCILMFPKVWLST